MGSIVLERLALPTRPRSDALRPDDRRAEDLHFGARDTLEDIRREFGTQMMMLSLREVARHFEVDEQALLDVWVKHYGPGFVAAARRA